MAGQGTHPKLPDSRSIRVIKLHGAANISDEIRFDLITTSLDEPLPYEAISYTWSGQALDRPVYANGQEYHVTKNAEDVMRRLRPSRPDDSRNLWIDAICINQKDDAEKSVQVQLMFEVYANAERVNIWLGQGTDATALALQWLRWYSWSFAAAWKLQSKFASAIRSADSIFIRLLLGIAAVSMSCICACMMMAVGALILLPFGLLPVCKSAHALKSPPLQKKKSLTLYQAVKNSFEPVWPNWLPSNTGREPGQSRKPTPTRLASSCAVHLLRFAWIYFARAITWFRPSTSSAH
jgi:hypothetical protein